jgi:oligosaccharide repeat unit polymerase
MMTEVYYYLAVILISLGSIFYAYTKISIYDRSWLNCLTVVLGFSILTTYIFEIIRILYVGSAGYSPLGLLFCYMLTPAYFWGLAFAYMHIKVRPISFDALAKEPTSTRIVAYALLILAWVMFLPVLISLSRYITDPRAIYTHIKETEIGSLFFLSSAIARVSLIVFLIKRNRGRIETFFFCIAASANVVMHGSQGQIISLIAIAIFMSVYVNQKRYRFWTIAGVAVGAAIFMTASLFLLFNARNTTQTFSTLASYSDYVGDSAILIDKEYTPHFGWITIEDNLIGRLPRILYPEKPKVFGLTSVSAQVRPYAYALGYFPGFLFGEETADFGLFALPVVLIEGFFAGLVMKSCRETLKRKRSIFAAIVFMYFTGGALLSLGLGSTLLEQTVMAAFIQFAASIRLLRPRRISPPGEAISPLA